MRAHLRSALERLENRWVKIDHSRDLILLANKFNHKIIQKNGNWAMVKMYIS